MFLHADWPVPASVHALTTLRHCGEVGRSQPPYDSFNLGNHRSADGDDPAAVECNRARLIEVAGLPSPPCWLAQVHGSHVQRFDAPPIAAVDAAGDVIRSAPPEADAAVTTTPGVVLAILHADCLPLLLAADDGSAIGAVHAGWRGLAAGVIDHAVAAMPVAASRLRAWLGPAAGPAAYEVGDEVRAAFVRRCEADAAAFVPTRAGHWHCDLYRLARRRLRDLGVEHVSGGGLCTMSAPERFFSHRRDGRTGRMATLVWRAD